MSRRDSAAEITLAALRSGILRPQSPRTYGAIAREVIECPTGIVLLVRLSAARWPERIALRDDDGAVTYRAVADQAEAVAAALHHSHGIGPGDTVGLMCRNGRGFLVGLLTVARLGADVVLLNTEFRQQALQAAIKNHEIGVLVCESEFSDMVAAAAPGTSTVEPGYQDNAGSAPRPRREGKTILLTSGTTGTPRGVPRDPKISTIVGMAATVINRAHLTVGTRSVVAVPFFHAFGLSSLLLTLALGGTVITRRKFDPTVTMSLCSEHHADSMMVVPAMISRILDADAPLDSHTPSAVLSGGSALLPAVATRFTARYGDVLFNGYGSSEVALASMATPADHRVAPGTVGKPVSGATVGILDGEGTELAPGGVGRIFVGGRPAVGTYTRGGTKESVRGLLDTGDQGYLDEHGLLHVLGRSDDMIVSGGENVYPRAVENALAHHPRVVDACVFGVPDDEYGQRLAALIVTDDPTYRDAEELSSFLRESVSRFELPRDIRFTTHIPRNAAGKVDRPAAIAQFDTEQNLHTPSSTPSPRTKKARR